MLVKQLSVFIENRAGRLAAATRVLAEHEINILALSLADTADYGILRMIVSAPQEACALLKDAGFTVVVNRALAVEVEDRPGGLDDVLRVLESEGINLEYMYAFASVRIGRAALIFRFSDNEAAFDALTQAGVGMLSSVDVLEG